MIPLNLYHTVIDLIIAHAFMSAHQALYGHGLCTLFDILITSISSGLISLLTHVY